jgi:hypothetical protein
VRFGSPPGIGLLMKWMICERASARRASPAAAGSGPGPGAATLPVGRPAAAPVAPVDHQLAHQLDRRRILDRQEGHRRGFARHELLLALFAQQVAHADRDIAEIDVDRAGSDALVADRAVIGDVVELVEMPQRDAAPGLLLVEEGFDQQRGGEDLVARRVKQVGARHVRRADRLALAAAQAVLDHRRDVADLRLLHDQRLGAEQRERRACRPCQVGAGQQLALVETAFRVDRAL